MKMFIAFYVFLLIVGTVLVDLFVRAPAHAGEPGARQPTVETPKTRPAAPLPSPAPETRVETPASKVPAPAPSTRALPPLPENLKASGRYKAWGLTQTRVSTSNGDFEGGVFLEFLDINTMPLKAMYFENKKWNGPLVFPADKVALFGGSLDGAETADLQLLQRYYFLRGQLDTPPPAPATAARAEPPAPDPNTNPHEAEYKVLAKKWLDFKERDKTLNADFKTATGAARVKISNELREMKQEEPVLIRDLNTIQAKYNDWKAKNPAPAAKPASKPVANPTPPANTLDPARAAEYREELKKLEPGFQRIWNP